MEGRYSAHEQQQPDAVRVPPGRRGAMRRTIRKGAEMVEFGLVLIPILGFIGLTVDIAWGVFARCTLQHAVREGARFAVTARTLPGKSYHIESIKEVVQRQSLGLLAGDRANKIHVRFYKPEDFSDAGTGPGANAGGNLVEVSVEDFSWAPLLPIWRNGSPLRMSARSIDRMETLPPGETLPAPVEEIP